MSTPSFTRWIIYTYNHCIYLYKPLFITYIQVESALTDKTLHLEKSVKTLQKEKEELTEVKKQILLFVKTSFTIVKFAPPVTLVIFFEVVARLRLGQKRALEIGQIPF